MGYQGKSGIQTIKWNASSTKVLDPYIHQIPIYKVTFTLSSSGIKAVFDAMDDNYKNYDEGWNDGRYFGYPVGIEFWTSDTTNNHIIIQSDGLWYWGPGYGNHTLTFVKTWNQLGINNINSYINTNNKSIYFRPLCVGCDMVNNPKSVLTRFTNDPQRTDWPSTCDSYTYQIIKDHTHIAKPIPILSKTTGTTITVKTPNTSCQIGLVNSNNYVSSWKSVNGSCKYTFTGLTKGNTYKIRVRQECSCGAYFYNDLIRNNSTNIRTWSISDNTETNQNTYKQLTFKANYTAGTRGDNNESSEQITYNLWKLSSDNEVSSLVNTLTEDNNTAVTFTGLQNSTNYLCKAYITGGIADQNNNADAVVQIRRGTGRPYSVSQYINNKTTTTAKLKISIKNLQYTYRSSNTNGLNSITIQVFKYNNNTNSYDIEITSLARTITSSSDLQSNSNIDKEIEFTNLTANTKYRIQCTYLGYSKYGIDHTSSVVGEKSQQTLNSCFTTNKETSIILTINNLVSSIKAVKFDLLSTEAKSNLPSGSSKYKMELYYINDNGETLDQTLTIPNSMFVENGSGSKLEGASFGVYFKNATATLNLHYDNYSSANMQPTAGIRCNSLYRIDVIDTSNNNEVVLEKYFRTDPLFAVVDDIIQTQDSLEFHVYAIDKAGNYIQTDAINKSTVFKETEIEPIIALKDVDYQNESLDSFLYANNTQIGKLNDNQNGTYSYINTIINSNPALWTASSTDDDSKTSFTVKRIIYKYKSLVYYTMHRAKLGISDGYNTVYTTKLIATSFPYNYIYYNGSWHKLMPYIYYDGSWQPLVVYIRYNAGWRLSDGNS